MYDESFINDEDLEGFEELTEPGNDDFLVGFVFKDFKDFSVSSSNCSLY